MVLLESNDKKSIKLHGYVKDHMWSPTDNLLCAYVPEHNNIPARVVLQEIPSRQIVGEKALFKVISCVILWQPKGDYLAVKVDLQGKSKKKTVTALEFFRIRERNIPVEDLKLDDTVEAFSWEPKGHRFAIIHSEPENRVRSVSFYTMAGTTVRKLETLDKRTASHLLWSPRGRFIVMFSNNGIFEFYDAENQETMAKDKQHLMATDITWDPIGRYVTTYVSGWKAKTEHGYKIWSFRGIELQSLMREGFYQFAWRPRPPTLLSEDQLKELEDPAFFKNFRAKYKAEDRIKSDFKIAEELQFRLNSRKKFREYFTKKQVEYEEDVEFRKSLGIEAEDDEGYLVEELVEETIDVTEDIIED